MFFFLQLLEKISNTFTFCW